MNTQVAYSRYTRRTKTLRTLTFLNVVLTVLAIIGLAASLAGNYWPGVQGANIGAAFLYYASIELLAVAVVMWIAWAVANRRKNSEKNIYAPITITLILITVVGLLATAVGVGALVVDAYTSVDMAPLVGSALPSGLELLVIAIVLWIAFARTRTGNAGSRLHSHTQA